MKRVLVTGGAGFIGSHLVERLLELGEAHVIVVDNFDNFYDPSVKRRNLEAHKSNSHFSLIEADIRDSSVLSVALGDVKGSGSDGIDTIFHLAARAGVRASLDAPVLYESVNVAGTLSLLELARRFDTRRFIFGSSSSVYGPSAQPPFVESAIPAPISPYAATKAAGELLLHAYSHLYGLQSVALRFFTAYGPRQRPDLAIHKFARLIDAGKPIPVFGDGSTERDYTYVADIVTGILAAADYNASNFEIINLGESRTVRLDYLISLLEQELGKKASIQWLPSQPGDMPRTHADITKAATLLGYSPTTPIERGIAEFVKWMKNTPDNLIF